MLKTGLQLPCTGLLIQNEEESLKKELAHKFRLHEKEFSQIQILKKSLDARKKSALVWVYTVAFSCKNEKSLLKRDKKLSLYQPKEYVFPYANVHTCIRPVICGMGPAGLFAALVLARSGVRPILIDRGLPVEERLASVEKFWKEGKLDPESNVQFGEGGAGTFSDGKLTTGISDERIAYVLNTFVQHGAPASIRYLAKPHIGTDVLYRILLSIRKELVERGCELLFSTKLTKLITENSKLRAVVVSQNGQERRIETPCLLLAIGNGARDTFAMLEKAGLAMQPKSFAVGVRIEHLQKDIDLAQYGEMPTLGTAFPSQDRSSSAALPASDYKLACHLENGHSVFSFCVCPGGRVVAAASEEGYQVTNGMSYSSRNGENCNGGLLVSVTGDTFATPASAIAFQRQIERAAFVAGGENYAAPCQRVGDFLKKIPSKGPGKVLPTYQPGVKYGNLWDVLPAFVCESIKDALPYLDRKIKGFAQEDALLTAVESRSSSPVCILRDERLLSNVDGVYPCGEGAGYAGGIMSACVDGIKCAQALCLRFLLA